MAKLGYKTIKTQPNGNCLFECFTTAAAQKGIAMDVWQARQIGASAWSAEEAIQLRFMYMQDDGGMNTVFQWMLEHAGASIIEDDNALVAAYQHGESVALLDNIYMRYRNFDIFYTY